MNKSPLLKDFPYLDNHTRFALICNVQLVDLQHNYKKNLAIYHVKFSLGHFQS